CQELTLRRGESPTDARCTAAATTTAPPGACPARSRCSAPHAERGPRGTRRRGRGGCECATTWTPVRHRLHHPGWESVRFPHYHVLPGAGCAASYYPRTTLVLLLYGTVRTCAHPTRRPSGTGRAGGRPLVATRRSSRSRVS